MTEIGKQVKTLFDLCTQLQDEQQVEFIQSSDFPETVKHKVLRLLKNQNKDIDISDLLIDAVKRELAIEDLKAGDLFNEFQLIKPIGHGGQGDVWLAKRVDGQFEQQVAIKILKPIYKELEEQRFLAERSLLAQLSHPHIAQLITGGKYSDDRHYMVLEWVDGTDIIDYARQKQLTLKQRLRLFMQVCEAVSYAHQNGIIHRDIKPSNVMVDQNGVVKLLDFGVAKTKNLNLTKTQHEQMLTMAYASPEQIKGEKVSTVSDVYSLGTLLYELLTDAKAHCDDSSSPAQMIKRITAETPTPPSDLMADREDSYVNHKINKELDNLVLMALRKEPNRRYQTVNDLRQDLKNYLDHKPLMAGGDSWLYRTKKFLLRNPLATTMTLILIAVMVFLQISLVNFNRQIAVQRDQALSAQKNAEHQARLANQTRDFLLNILKAASPLGSQGKDIRLDDVLAIGEKQIINSVEDEPILKSELLKTFGSIQHNLGHYQTAFDYYQNTYDLAMDNSLFVDAILAKAQSSLNAAWMNDYDLALKQLNEGDVLLPKIDDIEQQAWYQIIKATVLTDIGQREEGLALAQKVLEDVTAAGIEEAKLLGRIHNELGVSYAGVDNNQSYAHSQQALAFARQVNGDTHPSTYKRLINTANSLERIERYDEADQLFIEARRIGELIYPENHPDLGHFMAERAVHFHDRGAFSQALPMYKKALEVVTINAGNTSEDYAVRLNNLAYLMEDMGRLNESEDMYRKSIELRIKLMGEDSLSVASARGNLARVLAKQGKAEEALALSDLVMPIYEANGRDNFYNEVTLWSIKLQQSVAEGCGLLLNDMKPFLQELNNQSDKSWRRLGAEFWLAQEFYRCRDYDTANILLKSVLRINDNVYLADSYGHNMIKTKATELLPTIRLH